MFVVSTYMTVRPHKKLIVWKNAIVFVKEVYTLSNSLPPQERYGLVSQHKRAAVSIMLNIAEGSARSSKKEFLHFLIMSRGSVSEVDAILEILMELGDINTYSYKHLLHMLNNLSALLQGLINIIKSEINT